MGQDLRAQQWLANVRERLAGVLSAPLRLGRYELGRELGAGGMGLVYEARDPQLDRPVAIKLLRSAGPRDAARLQREARALAELSHPNVVEVFDVGSAGDQLYLVMELVRGRTLDDWLRGTDPMPALRSKVLLDAGRGLAAAHSAGVIHRDFKPGNVLVGDDDRARVLDFGLAALGSTEDTLRSDEIHATWEQPKLTRTGALLGTPAYMSPEQARNEELGPATDQFSYCVTVFEALTGQRPIVEESLTSLLLRIATCDGIEAALTRVPRRIRGVLARGLQRRPEDRFASMGALLDALERAVRPRRALWIGGAAVGFVGLTAAVAVGGATASLSCEDIVWTHAGIWTDTLGEDGRPWADRWREQRRSACELARVAPGPATDAVVACLDRVSGSATVAAELLAERPSGDPVRADILAGLPEPEACTGRRGGDPRAEAIRGELDRCRVEQAAGLMTAATATAAAALSRARETGDAELVAEALVQHGSALLQQQGFAESRRAFEEAHGHAQKFGRDDLVIQAALGVARVGVMGQLPDLDAARWVRSAEAALQRHGDDDRLRVEFLQTRGQLSRIRGDLKAASNDLEAALALTDGKAELRRARVTTTQTLGSIELLRGRFDEAIRRFESARRDAIEVLGPDHPRIGRLEGDLGSAHLYRGDVDEAQRWLERALQHQRTTLGPKHEAVAMTLSNLAIVRWRQGDMPGAIEGYEEGLAAFEAALGPEHSQVAQALDNLGTALHYAGRYDDALQRYARSLVIKEQHLGPKHPGIAVTLNHIAQAYEAKQDFASARPRADRALQILTTTHGPTHHDVAQAHATVGRIAIGQRRYPEAIAAAEKAIEIYDTLGAGPLERGAARADLAYALTEGDPEATCARSSDACRRAEQLVAAARAAFEQAGPLAQANLAALDMWAPASSGVD